MDCSKAKLNYQDVLTWVNPSAWDSDEQAEQVIDAILSQSSEAEEDWIRIAQEFES